MAEENESIDILLKRMLELARTGKLTSEDLQKLDKSAKDTTLTMKDVGKATQGLFQGVTNFANSVAGGNTELNAMKGIVSKTGEVLGDLVSKIPLVGKAASGMSKAVAAFTNIAIDRLQASYDSFTELSKAGLIGSDGILGMRDNMIKAGIPLQKWTKIIGKSAEDLAYFSGTALEGGKNFTQTMIMMQNATGQPLRALGMNIEEIGDTVVDFQTTYRRLGFTQTMTTDQLSRKTVEYGKELDMMAKLTGQQRKDIQKQREDLLSHDKFRAYIVSRQQKGDKDSLQAITNISNALSTLPKSMQGGIEDLIVSGGAVTSEASAKIIQQFGDQGILPLLKGLREGSVGAVEFNNKMIQMSRNVEGRYADVTRFGADVGISQAALSDEAKKRKVTIKTLQDLYAAQHNQINQTDKLTSTVTASITNLEKASASLDSMILNVDVVTSSVEMFSSALLNVANFMNEKLGAGSMEGGMSEVLTNDYIKQLKRMGVNATSTGSGEESKVQVSRNEYIEAIKENRKAYYDILQMKKEGFKNGQWETKELEKQYEIKRKIFNATTQKTSMLKSLSSSGKLNIVNTHKEPTRPTTEMYNMQTPSIDTSSLVTERVNTRPPVNGMSPMQTSKIEQQLEIVAETNKKMVDGIYQLGVINEKHVEETRKLRR